MTLSHDRIRAFLFPVVGIAHITATLACGAEQAAHIPRSSPPLHGLEEIGCQHVRLQGGFWGPRLDIHHRTTIPHVLNKLEERNHITNFDKAAAVLRSGKVASHASGPVANAAEKAHEGDAGNNATSGPGAKGSDKPDPSGIVGHSAFDSDVHKALEGACLSLSHHKDPDLHQRMESILDRILAAQQDDGYLVSYFIAKEPQKRWSDLRTNHEMYNAGHFFECAVAHHQLTGKTHALDAAKRFADHMDRTFGEGKRYDVDGHQGVELALVKLFRATGEKRYLDLCRFLLDERGHAHGTERKPFTPGPFVEPERQPGLTDHEYSRVIWRAKLYWRNGRMQDHKPVLQQTEAVGHAVRAGYMYAAMTDIARFSNAPEYAQAVRTLWDDVVHRKMHLTGGIGTAQNGDEGFGDPYKLPNKTYCESCACIAHTLWQHRMSLMDGHAKYADVMELTLYNSALSGMSLAGNSFLYQNPLESRNGEERRDWIGLACCPTNLARFTPQISGLVYARGKDAVVVNLYAAGEAKVALDGDSTVTLRQDTSFPWNGKMSLSISIDQPRAFDLRLRIPGWACGHPVPGDLYRSVKTPAAAITLTVNGNPMDALRDASGYFTLHRTWKSGDVVALDLPMPVQRVLAHDKLEENRGKTALMRGPLVYCFEGLDNPGVDLFSVSLPLNAELKTEHRENLLGGVTVIHTTGVSATGKPVPLTAIPYLAWANRGKTPMNIWLTEHR